MQDILLVAGVVVVLGTVFFFVFSGRYQPASVFIHEKVLLNPPATVHNVRPVGNSDHIQGRPDAPIKVIEYSDLECPYCKVNHFTMKRILKEYDGDVAWIFRHHPLDHLHSKGRTEAQAAECVASIGGNDAFWEFLEEIFRVTPSNDGLDLSLLPEIAETIGVNKDDFNDCIQSEKFVGKVQKDITNAKRSGLSFTPSTIVIWPDGEQKSLIIGARQYGVVTAALDIILGREVSLEDVSSRSTGDNFSQ